MKYSNTFFKNKIPRDNLLLTNVLRITMLFSLFASAEASKSNRKLTGGAIAIIVLAIVGSCFYACCHTSGGGGGGNYEPPAHDPVPDIEQNTEATDRRNAERELRYARRELSLWEETHEPTPYYHKGCEGAEEKKLKKAVKIAESTLNRL